MIDHSSTKQRVALGMSGGVDSSLCAHLLVEQGYDVTGVYLECWRAPGCRSEEDRADALKVALSLNIPFQVLDFKETYKQKVVENFFHDYEAGLIKANAFPELGMPQYPMQEEVKNIAKEILKSSSQDKA